MSLNLHDIVNPGITAIVDNQPITICIPITSQNTNYDIISSYTQVNMFAQIQLMGRSSSAGNQKLIHKDYYQHNQIYKKFYVSYNNLTGLNRNIGTNGDYIIWNNLYYKIVEVIYNFQSGWVLCIGCESSDFTSG